MVEPCVDSMRDGPRSLALASPVLAWAVIGDVSETDLPNPDYMFQPPEVSTSVAVLVVAVAVVLATCGGATTVGGFRRGLLGTTEPMAAAPLLAAGLRGVPLVES